MTYDTWKSTNPADEWLGPEDGYEMPANPDYGFEDEEERIDPRDDRPDEP